MRYKKLSLKDKGKQEDEDEDEGVMEEEEEETRKTSKKSGTSVNTGGERTAHKLVFPLRTKGYTYARWSCGVGIIVTLIGLIVAAIALISVAPGCDTPWWKTTIIYQCYPQSFQDSDGDGIGDLQGILQRANYFTELGVTAVWLNPIFESPQGDAGYDISNYTAIDSRYGTMDNLKQLLDELHRRGVHLLLDLVPNHTSDQHSWFKESRSSRTNPKRNWYVWADGKDNGPPNNWLSLFGGSAWQYDNTTNQYYLHQFASFQPDLNYSNPEVRSAIRDVLAFWLDFGVDGFRVDAVAFLLEDPQLHDETADSNFSPPPNVNCSQNASSRHCYGSLVHNLTSNLPGIHAIFREWRQVANRYGRHDNEKILIGEVYGPLDVVQSYYGGTRNNEFTFPFNFFLLTNTNWTGSAVHCIVFQFMDSLPSGAWPSWVLGNHDNSRIASKAGTHLADALNVLLLTLPGTPTTYYGEEIRMTDVAIAPSQRKDVSDEDRDKERTPMQWNTSTHAGFTTGTPWLPISPNYTTYNVHTENSTNSTLLLYKQLSRLRSRPSFQTLNYQCINATDQLLAYIRYSSDSSEQFLVIINFSEDTREFELTVSLSNAEVVLSTSFDRSGSLELPGNVTLSGGEAMVVRGSRSEESCETESKQLCTMCNTTLTA